MNENLNCPYCYSEHVFVKKTLDVTEFKCGRCGLIISGDSQAAMIWNILQKQNSITVLSEISQTAEKLAGALCLHVVKERKKDIGKFRNVLTGRVYDTYDEAYASILASLKTPFDREEYIKNAKFICALKEIASGFAFSAKEAADQCRNFGKIVNSYQAEFEKKFPEINIEICKKCKKRKFWDFSSKTGHACPFHKKTFLCIIQHFFCKTVRGD